MLKDWVSVRRHSLLRPSDEAEIGKKVLLWTSWPKLRRIRAVALLLLLLVAFFLCIPPSSMSRYGKQEIWWSEFAYLQYVTNQNYLCNSVMILEALHRHGAKADRMMMYPEDWNVPEDASSAMDDVEKLLAQARDEYRSKLVPVKVQINHRGDSTWRQSYTKLLAFNQTQYKRVISLDSDAVVQRVSAVGGNNVRACSLL